jgi:hypothetical protein
MTREDFFAQILGILQPEGVDPKSVTYYSENQAQSGEWANIIEQAFARTAAGSPERAQFVGLLSDAGFFKGSDNLNFWINDASPENIEDVADLSNAAEQRFPSLLGGSGVETSQGTENEDVNQGGVGTTTTILTSQNMQWSFDRETGKWSVAYKLPNSNRFVFYQATGSQMDAIFGDGQRPTNYSTTTFSELAEKDGYTYGGSISEIEGKGSFEAEVKDTVSRALDEGHLPPWAANDPKIMDLLYIKVAEDKSADWLIDQIAKLDSFKARFPGIEAFTSLGLTNTEAVGSFIAYEGGVKKLTRAQGGDAESVTPDLVGSLITKGHSLDDVTKAFDMADTLSKNTGAFDAFNDILEARGMAPLDTNMQLDFLEGVAPKELYEIWEETSLLRSANEAGLGLTTAQAVTLAARTEGTTSYEAASEALAMASQNILRFRSELELERYGLTHEDLIDMSLGLPPSSGMTQAEVARSIEKVVGSARANRDRLRANPFKSFDDQGVQQNASLGRARQEAV